MNSSHQNIKKMIEKLEKNGYIEVKTDEKGKRKQRFFLTEKTAEFTKRYDKPSKAFMEYLFGGINKEELGITIKTLLEIDDRLKAYPKQLE